MLFLVLGVALILVGWYGAVLFDRRSPGRASWELNNRDWLAIYGLMIALGIGALFVMFALIELFAGKVS